MWKHARMINLMRSVRTLINGCYHPAQGTVSFFMPLGLGQIRGGGGWGAFSMQKKVHYRYGMRRSKRPASLQSYGQTQEI